MPKLTTDTLCSLEFNTAVLEPDVTQTIYCVGLGRVAREQADVTTQFLELLDLKYTGSPSKCMIIMAIGHILWNP